jgi:hypothetical protein
MTKRAHGEGTIRQRRKGLWEARISYVDPLSGHQQRMSLYAPTAEAVRDKLDETRERIKADASVRDSSQRLADWIAHWSVTSLEASSRKQSTKMLYCNLARKHLSPRAAGCDTAGQAAQDAHRRADREDAQTRFIGFHCAPGLHGAACRP